MYQKYEEFHAGSKPVEKNAIKLLAKKFLTKIVEHSGVLSPSITVSRKFLANNIFWVNVFPIV